MALYKLYPCREEPDEYCDTCAYTIICEAKDATSYAIFDEAMGEVASFDTREEALEYASMTGMTIQNSTAGG